jgi:hypothetical protein
MHFVEGNVRACTQRKCDDKPNWSVEDTDCVACLTAIASGQVITLADNFGGKHDRKSAERILHNLRR